MTPLLEIRNLDVSISTEDGMVRAVDQVSVSVGKGKTLGLVGESGSGKSITALSVIGLTRFAKNISTSGEVLFDNRDLASASDEELRRLRGNGIGMIFQDPLTSLHPFLTIGRQLVEGVQAHQKLTAAKARLRAVEMLNAVGIARAKERLDAYPHEFSGGMRQRVMIALALINQPRLLIADEPTTALDVTVQAQILELIQELQAKLEMALILISHDLGVVADMADDVAVMYAGRIVERGDKHSIYTSPEHPYTWGLLRSIPRPDVPREQRLLPIPGQPPSLIRKPSGCAFHPRCPYVQPRHRETVPELLPLPNTGGRHEVACHLPDAERRALWSMLSRQQMQVQQPSIAEAPASKAKLVEVRSLTKRFPLRRGVILQREWGAVQAVDEVSFDVMEGEALGIVGESGSGKTTLARLLAGLVPATGGEILYRGRDIASLSKRELKPLRRQIQVIFQDPYSSLSPRKTVGSIIGEPLVIHGLEPDRRARKLKVRELMDKVGLSREHYNRMPHEFSGGQRQRIAVARAIALEPTLIIADEPVSALDVSIQAQILNLLRDLQEDLGLTTVFISHDLSVVRRVCNRVAVMYLGRLVEIGSTDDVYRRPSHPYTAALLSAAPVPNPEAMARRQRLVLAGDIPSPLHPPPACHFHPRCPKAVQGTCDVATPTLERRGATLSACHFPLTGAEITNWIGLTPAGEGSPSSSGHERGAAASASAIESSARPNG